MNKEETEKKYLHLKENLKSMSLDDFWVEYPELINGLMWEPELLQKYTTDIMHLANDKWGVETMERTSCVYFNTIMEHLGLDLRVNEEDLREGSNALMDKINNALKGLK